MCSDFVLKILWGIFMEIINNNIDGGKGFDWGRTSEDYAKFRDIYPEVFYQKLIKMGLCVEGQHVLDIGTGTGVLPRNLYKYGAVFTGVDISENQISQARRLSEEAGMNIEFIVSPAEEIALPDNQFDLVTACQCYAYFDKDIIFQKIRKLLKSGGHFCILYVVYLTDESEIAFNSERLVLKYNPHWSAGGMKRYTYELPKQAVGLFEVEDSFFYDVSIPFTRESWHGRMKTCRGIGASILTTDEIEEWEAEHIAYLKTVPQEFEMPHFVTTFNLLAV